LQSSAKIRITKSNIVYCFSCCQRNFLLPLSCHFAKLVQFKRNDEMPNNIPFHYFRLQHNKPLLLSDIQYSIISCYGPSFHYCPSRKRNIFIRVICQNRKVVSYILHNHHRNCHVV
jgi:hypothetical protein